MPFKSYVHLMKQTAIEIIHFLFTTTGITNSIKVLNSENNICYYFSKKLQGVLRVKTCYAAIVTTLSCVENQRSVTNLLLYASYIIRVYSIMHRITERLWSQSSLARALFRP